MAITLPIFDWFIGDPFKKTGNRYVGSVGATSITANAFCYRVWLERGEDGAKLIAESFDVLTKNQPDTHAQSTFDGNEEGHAALCAWLDAQYEEYVKAKRNELVVSFH